jgi:hypothetical protein
MDVLVSKHVKKATLFMDWCLMKSQRKAISIWVINQKWRNNIHVC